jgi:hypothetical protein
MSTHARAVSAATWSTSPSFAAASQAETSAQEYRLARRRRTFGSGKPPGPRSPATRTHYDTDAAARVIGASRYPDAHKWVAEYVLNHYPDTEALAAFTAIAREQATSS